MDCWHVTIASEDRAHAFPDVLARRRAVRAVCDAAAPWLALFCVVDDHVHCVLAADRRRAGRVGQALGVALGSRFPRAEFAPARIRPVKGRRHCASLVPYVLRQTEHHGLGTHPSLWEGSCFMDLVGARRGLAFTPGPLHRLLPRLQHDEIWRAADALPPRSEHDLHLVAPPTLWEAARVAFAVVTPSKSPGAMAAKRATMALGRRAGATTATLATVMGVTRQTAGRLARAGVTAGEFDTVVRQLALRNQRLARGRSAA